MRVDKNRLCPRCREIRGESGMTIWETLNQIDSSENSANPMLSPMLNEVANKGTLMTLKENGGCDDCIRYVNGIVNPGYPYIPPRETVAPPPQTQSQIPALIRYWLKMWRKYAVFGGRATRAEFWYANLGHAIFYTATYLLAIASGGEYLVIRNNSVHFGQGDSTFVGIHLLYSFATIIPLCALFTRRLHDVGKSGKLILIFVVPCAIMFILMILTSVKDIKSLAVIVLVSAVATLILFIYLIVLLASQGEYGANQYGDDPRI